MANKRLIDRRHKSVFKYQTNIDHKPFFIICSYIFQGHTSYKNSALEKLNELWQPKTVLIHWWIIAVFMTCTKTSFPAVIISCSGFIFFLHKYSTIYNTVNKGLGMMSNNWKGNINIDYIVCLHITYKANTKLHLNLLVNINQE